MCVTEFTIWSYNTHLFGNTIGKLTGQAYDDNDRKHNIIQFFQNKPTGPTIIAFEEIWDAGYAGDFAHDLDVHGGYTHLINDVHKTELLNISGLALFAGPNMSFSETTYYDYILLCTKLDGWSLQDLPTGKGYLKAKCEFTCSNNHQHKLGLFITHMPTNYSTHKDSVSCCFSSLAAAVAQFRGPNHHPNDAVIVMGDLNVAGDSATDKYTTLVQNTLMSGTGLQNAMPPDSSAGYSIDGQTNTLWQYFNKGTPAKQERIDYVFYANSGDDTMTVSLKSATVVTDGLTIPGSNPPATVNDSDHYPVQVVLEITAQD